MAKNYHMGWRLATFEFGGRFRNAHKFDNSFTPDFRCPRAYRPFADEPISERHISNSSYYGGSYPLGPNPGYRDVLAAFNAVMPGRSFDRQPSSYRQQLRSDRKGLGRLLMNTIDFNSRIRFIAGVRFEGTNLDTSPVPRSTRMRTSSDDDQVEGSYVKVLAERLRPLRYYEQYGCARRLRPRPFTPQPVGHRSSGDFHLRAAQHRDAGQS